MPETRRKLMSTAVLNLDVLGMVGFRSNRSEFGLMVWHSLATRTVPGSSPGLTTNIIFICRTLERIGVMLVFGDLCVSDSGLISSSLNIMDICGDYSTSEADAPPRPCPRHHGVGGVHPLVLLNLLYSTVSLGNWDRNIYRNIFGPCKLVRQKAPTQHKANNNLLIIFFQCNCFK